MSGFEVLTIWTQRPIVEKQSRLGFYHPAAEVVSAMVCDLPNKTLSSMFFNVTTYFLANLRRTPEAFFTFLVFSFVCLLTMSMFFRRIGSLCRTFTQTFVPVGVIMFM
jgi:ATP-binding cassette subfamily G (WHITE) protein 2 (PDR)